MSQPSREECEYEVCETLMFELGEIIREYEAKKYRADEAMLKIGDIIDNVMDKAIDKAIDEAFVKINEIEKMVEE